MYTKIVFRTIKKNYICSNFRGGNEKVENSNVYWNIFNVVFMEKIKPSSLEKKISQHAFLFGSPNKALLFSCYVCTCEVRRRETGKK